MAKFLFVSAIAALGTVVLGAPGDILETRDSYTGFGRTRDLDPIFDISSEYIDFSGETNQVVLDLTLRTNRGRRNQLDRFMNFAIGVVSSELYCGNPKSGSDCIPEPTVANQNQSPWNIADDQSTLNGKIATYMASKYLFVSSRYSQSERLGTCRVLLVDQLCSSYSECVGVVDNSNNPVRGNEGFRLAKGVAVQQGRFTDVTDQVSIEETSFSLGPLNTQMELKIRFDGNLFGGANSPFQFAKADKTYLTWAQWYKSFDNRQVCETNDARSDYQLERDVKQALPNTATRADGFSINVFTTAPPTGAPTKSPTPEPTNAPSTSPTMFPTRPPVPTRAPVPTRSPTTASPTESPTSFPTASPVVLPCPHQRSWYTCGIINSWWSHIELPFHRERRIRNRCRSTRGCAYCASNDPNQQNCQPRVAEDGSLLSVQDVCSGNIPGAGFSEPRCQQYNECPTPEEMSACRIFNQKHRGYQKRKCERGFTVTVDGERFTAGRRKCAYANGICRAVGRWFPFRKAIVKQPGLFDKIRSCPFDARDPDA